MGFREPLDLAEVIQEYQGFLSGTPGYRRPLTEAERAYYAATEQPNMTNTRTPHKWGVGPDWCSTSTTLVKPVVLCWDVNGYYAHLGVHWQATRRELRDAFLAGDHANNPRSAYVLKQLLDHETRAAYDRVRLGDRFMDDYLQAEFKAAAIKESVRRRVEDGVEITAEVIMDQWGLTLGETSLPGTLDRDADLIEPSGSEDQFSRWDYSYYLWRSGCQDTERLAAWQAMVVSVLAQKGVMVRLRLGYLGKEPHPYTVDYVDDRWVLFLNEGLDPNENIAGSAAEAFLREIHS